MPREMRTMRDVATAGRPWTSEFGRLAAALALVAVSILAWPTIASASPGPVAGGDGLAITARTVAATRTVADVQATRPGITTNGARRTGPAPASERSSALPTKVPPGKRLIEGQHVIAVGEPWLGGSLNASTSQGVPFALGALVLIFVLAQWLIDRRDPKFVEAPARRHEDSIGFE
jgi:hypothetical protein